jgi:hypothetical protein
MRHVEPDILNLKQRSASHSRQEGTEGQVGKKEKERKRIWVPTTAMRAHEACLARGNALPVLRQPVRLTRRVPGWQARKLSWRR